MKTSTHFNIQTARKLGRVEYDLKIPDLAWSETLYRTDEGGFFLHLLGGKFSPYGSFSPDGWRIEGKRIAPISDEQARRWMANWHNESNQNICWDSPEF